MCTNTTGLERCKDHTSCSGLHCCAALLRLPVQPEDCSFESSHLHHPQLDAAMLAGPFRYAAGLVNVPCIDDKLHQPSLSPSVHNNIHHYMQEEMTVLLPHFHAQQLVPATPAAHRPEAKASSQPADAGFSMARSTTTQSLELRRWLAKRLQRAWLQQQLMRSWDLGVEAMCLGPQLRCSKAAPGSDHTPGRASMVPGRAAALLKAAPLQGRGSAVSGRAALLLRLLARAGASGSSRGGRRAPAGPEWWLCPATCRLRPSLAGLLLQRLGLGWALAE